MASMMFSNSVARIAQRLGTCSRQCRRVATAAAPAALLPVGLRAESVPRHVAVVMDGNSKWARARGLPTMAGHEALKPALEDIVRLSRAWGIRALTALAFSHENWNRPKAEVDSLMALYGRFIRENLDGFVREGVHLRLIGDCSRLSVCLQKIVKEAGEETSKNIGQLDLTLAISYSGQRDIVRACANLAHKVHDGLPCSYRTTSTSRYSPTSSRTSYANEFPCPDLLIKTGGELRLSNFLLWQSAYSELFFTNTFWPDFGEADYLEALISFQGRDRRFGQRKTKA